MTLPVTIIDNDNAIDLGRFRKMTLTETDGVQSLLYSGTLLIIVHTIRTCVSYMKYAHRKNTFFFFLKVSIPSSFVLNFKIHFFNLSFENKTYTEIILDYRCTSVQLRGWTGVYRPRWSSSWSSTALFS